MLKYNMAEIFNPYVNHIFLLRLGHVTRELLHKSEKDSELTQLDSGRLKWGFGKLA